MEEYTQITGYELYGISRSGQVKNLKTGRILKPKTSNKGYLAISLCNPVKRRMFNIHQLMAITYLNHEPDGMKLVVDHINSDKQDNRLENLQIITARQNCVKDIVKDLPIGVSQTANGKYKSRISIEGVRIYLGTFLDLEQAAQAYQQAIPK